MPPHDSNERLSASSPEERLDLMLAYVYGALEADEVRAIDAALEAEQDEGPWTAALAEARTLAGRLAAAARGERVRVTLPESVSTSEQPSTINGAETPHHHLRAVAHPEDQADHASEEVPVMSATADTSATTTPEPQADSQAQGPSTHRLSRTFNRLVSGLAAAVLIAVVLGLVVHEKHGREQAKQDHRDHIDALEQEEQARHADTEETVETEFEHGLAVDVAAPSTFHPDVPILLEVNTRRLDKPAEPVSAEAEVTLYRAPRQEEDEPLYRTTVRTDERGRANLEVPVTVDAGHNVLISVAAEQGEKRRATGTVLVREGSRLLGYVTTSKPLYRPNEVIYLRGVVLDRVSLKPASRRMGVRFRITDERDSVLFDSVRPLQNGAAWTQWQVPANQVGGDYTVELLDAHPQPRLLYTRSLRDGEAGEESEQVRLNDGQPVSAFPKAKRTIQIRNFRPSAYLAEIEFDRDSYAAGDRGMATIEVLQRDGRVPRETQLDVTLRIDGENLPIQRNLALGLDGRVKVPFRLPRRVDRGQATLSVAIRGPRNDSISKSIPLTSQRLDVQLFPEGGDLIAGVENRVYFVARNLNGEPVDMEASLVDTSGEVHGRFGVDRLGMGRFEFTPEAGKEYRISVVRPEEVRQSIALPEVQSEGVSLRSLRDTYRPGEPVEFTLASTHTGRHLIAGYLRGVQVGVATVELEAGKAETVRLPVPADKEGTLRVTVLDPHGNPAAERLVYRESSKRLAIDVSTDQSSYNPAENVELTLTTRDDKSGEPLGAFLGVVVVDEMNLNIARDEDTAPMPLHFLVGLEVEELEQVRVYLNGTEEASRALDNLLGTQGWRRFAWHDVEEFLERVEDKDMARRILPIEDSVEGMRGFEVPQTISFDVPPTEYKLVPPEFTAPQGPSLEHVLEQHEAEFATTARTTVIVAAGVLGLLAFLGLMFAFGRGSLVVARQASFLGVCLAALIVAASVDLAEHGYDRDHLTSSTPIAPDELNPARVAMHDGLPNDMSTILDGRLVDRTFDFALERLLEEDAADASGLDHRRRAGDPEAARWADGPNRGHQPHAAGGRPGAAERDGQAGGAAAAEPAIRARMAEDRLAVRPEAPRRQVMREVARNFVFEAPAIRDGERNDFTEAIFFDPLVITDAETGTATVTFDTSHSLTSWRVIVEGYTADGRLAMQEHTFTSRLPFSVEPKLPLEVTSGDRIDLPVTVDNATESDLPVDVTLEFDDGVFVARDGSERDLNVASNRAATSHFGLDVVGRAAGESSLRVTSRSGDFLDRFRHEVRVVPRGFPMSLSHSELLKGSAQMPVVIPDTVDPASIEGAIQLYTSPLADMLGGLEGMLRRPGGCFEQTSSANFPNIMVLQYMLATGQLDEEVQARAIKLLADGYNRLTSFEVDGGGFEWFGRGPSHTTLTAYGVLQFIEMAKVMNIDENLVPRTTDWLMSRLNEDGYFEQGRRHLHTWLGDGAQNLNTAYVCWALTEAGFTADDLGPALESLLDDVQSSEDPYLTALAALSFANIGETEEYQWIAEMLAAMQQQDGRLVGESQSVVASRGNQLNIETTALGILVFLQDERFLGNASRAVEWLIQQRSGRGYFGTTQGTVLALKALVEYATAAPSEVEGGQVRVLDVPTGENGELDFDNARELEVREMPAGTSEIFALKGFASALEPGKRHNLVLVLDSDDEIPFTFELRYHVDVPPSHDEAPLQISTRLDVSEARENSLVGLDVTLENVSDLPQQMPMAIIGIPGGTEPRVEQLRELRDAEAFAFFELREREIILYFDTFAPGESKELNLELTAAIPGHYTGPASNAYPYYQDTHRHWVNPLELEIHPVE